jgi:hypothetical protein
MFLIKTINMIKNFDKFGFEVFYFPISNSRWFKKSSSNFK